MTVVYPVSRLLSNPRIFLAISNHLGGVLDAKVLRDVFYELLEVEINGSPDEECEFSAEEACFEVEEDGLVYHIYFDTGASFKLEVTEDGFHPQISTEFELATASAVNNRLISAIEDSHPELKDDISFEHPPTPGNSFLSLKDGEGFSGSFHLRSDPDKRFSFTITSVDPESDHLEAKIKPL
jgi:hypothetical protein